MAGTNDKAKLEEIVGRMHRAGVRMLLLLVLGGLALTVDASPAFACSCGDVTPESLLEHADVMFIGAPVRVVLEAEGPIGLVRLWEFDVETVYKGEVSQGLAVSGGSGGEGACEVPLTEAFGSHAFAAHWSSGHLSTSLCSFVPAGDAIAALGSGYPPRLAGHTEMPPLAVAAVGLIVAIGLATVSTAVRRRVAPEQGGR